MMSISLDEILREQNHKGLSYPLLYFPSLHTSLITSTCSENGANPGIRVIIGHSLNTPGRGLSRTSKVRRSNGILDSV